MYGFTPVDVSTGVPVFSAQFKNEVKTETGGGVQLNCTDL